MKFKNRKTVLLLLMVAIILGNINLTHSYAIDVVKSNYIEMNNGKLIEINNGFIMEYEKFENGEQVYYYEEFKNNVVYTKKYIKEYRELKLIEELITTFKSEKNDIGGKVILAEIYNITHNTTFTEVVMEETIEVGYMRMQSRRLHPTDSTYYFSHGSTGHLGFSRQHMQLL
ncbi:hypothetical protein SAMN05661008_01089 [Alkalithermobacter thermoalcaliphilus JW-YL-7 = DSM 7308]|uniref:Uncharacterized protein n=1 Tax=Alkalithermobacter thermoalcaliphilus JW-YL-7 = DSM 7308 TaxID=1121328 RepID=A0A150FN93_CLOPD|nr:hypothetical protein JWYL7_0178 [[Clostridium] paradoxum JW-YL-7 = DSM 7308]SHK90035.1 hypothetical protein SAMN05661008_01089 [[Clostridium] paradoxum JW-YL-7 = DSM 7308]